MLLFLCFFVHGRELTDTVAPPVQTLEEVEVTGRGPAAVRRLDDGASQVLRINASGVARGLHRLGEADMVSAVARRGGIATTGEYGSGLVVNGADPSQTLFTIDGAPVLFPFRFGGIFSTFNTPHFSHARFEPLGHGASMPSRLGGLMELHSPDRMPSGGPEGSAYAGILASGASVRVPVGRRVALSGSARVSFFDRLYRPLLRNADRDISYNFADYNLTALWRPDSVTTVMASGFQSNDRLAYDDANYSMLLGLRWRNRAASVAWTRRGRVPMTLRAYASDVRSTLSFDMGRILIASPAEASVAGGEFSIKPLAWLTAGAQAERWRAVPEWANVSGDITYSGSNPETKHALELRLYADARVSLAPWLEAVAGVSAPRFASGGYSTFVADPRLMLVARSGERSVRLHGGVYHQFIHVTGFSDIGLASDFRVPASAEFPAQRSADCSLTFVSPVPGIDMTAEASVYYKRVENQPEFAAQLLDLVSDEYDYRSGMMLTRGYNTGVNLSVTGTAGPVGIDASYSYGITRRRAPGENGYYPGIHSPGHTLKADADLRCGRWLLGASFTLASGRVYTPVERIYLVANNIATVYGPHNSARTPPLHRLDLSATWNIPGGPGRLKQQLNFSLINAYGHKNIDFQYYTLFAEAGSYYLRRVSSLYRFVPSISYSVTFR